MLILFVLLQPGKSDAAAVFGGGVNSAAFGPRGTQTVLAKVTITAAIVFFLIAFLFNIPGLFEEKSVGEGITPGQGTTQPAPAQPAIPPTTEPQQSAPAAAPQTQPQGETATPSSPSNQTPPPAEPEKK